MTDRRTYGAAYMQRRRAAAVARGDCPVCCKRPKAATTSRCVECNELQRGRNAATYAGNKPYVPLEEMLAAPRVRVLRAMRWQDWTTRTGLMDLLEIPVSDRHRYRQVVTDAVARGELQRRDVSDRGEFRITNKGKAACVAVAVDYEQRLGEGVAA